ncbi:MAG: saccharopine dehydrogenase C-terminal domain-containing protein [Desulfatiglandaceae bacterium]|jgi:saccharopine dehydrogenase-like NADP-dependent oxidoreductase
MQITVLGVGLVGGAVVRDLAQAPDFHITAVDLSQKRLRKLEKTPRVELVQADLKMPGRMAALVGGCDLVISAVPGFMGFETVKQVVEAGKNVVDISFFGEDPFLLEGAAQRMGVTAIVDCGVAPGLCNIVAGHVDSLLEEIDRYACYVGGLPVVREWPYEYKAVFSPADVLEEYTRPVRLVEYGREIVRPALSEVERINFPGVGTLEAFNTDGLRTLRKTLNAPFMKEKTLRYPGHANLMRVFAESGFFSHTPIEINGQYLSPAALTSKLLFDKWKLEAGEADFTIMKIVLEGRKGEKRYRYTYTLRDDYDRETQTTSMARTTGYTCAIAARQLLSGRFARMGICPPEYIGRTGSCYEDLMAEYAKRNIRLTETITELPCL